MPFIEFSLIYENYLNFFKGYEKYGTFFLSHRLNPMIRIYYIGFHFHCHYLSLLIKRF